MKELIERIKAHVVDSEGCWIWKGATQNNGSPIPVMGWQGKTNKVRRFLAVSLGLQVEGRVATHKCGNPLCVKPQHVEVVTRSEMQRRIANSTHHQKLASRRARMSETKRSKAKLTAEMVAEIRASTDAQEAIAKRYGVSQATVSEIKRGRLWRDYSNPWQQLMKATK